MNRAAVVIGVNRTRDLSLQELRSAASGAKTVAVWLEEEGYEVVCLTDEKMDRVTASDVFEAVSQFVTLPVRYDFLLVYFSGHGYWASRADYWLLSGAPNNPNESINLRSSMELAKYSGIANVVFVSDACRSIPLNRSGQLLSGSDAFPNHPEISSVSKIDFFKATSESLPAYEAKLEGESHSILTRALISAYREPDPSMVSVIGNGIDEITMIPNRNLEGYLQRRVDNLLAKVPGNLNQRLEVSVPSDDETYIARACLKQIDREGGRPVSRAIYKPTVLFPVNKADRPRVESMIPDVRQEPFQSRCGFVIKGAVIRDVLCAKGNSKASVEIVAYGGDETAEALVQVWDVDPAVSVFIELVDGRSVILACLKDYIGYAQFDAVGLINVSYISSDKNQNQQISQKLLAEVNLLRAKAAQAAEFNELRLESPQLANELLQKIRLGKSIDPTLGLYAVTAFAQASMQDKAKTSMDYMRADLKVDLFDVCLLANRALTQFLVDEYCQLVPMCPMLTQNWHLLASRNIQLPAAIENLRPYVLDSLWTTFGAGASEHLIRAFKSGEFE